MKPEKALLNLCFSTFPFYPTNKIFVSSSNIVRADKEDDGINSKNLIPGNGKITTVLNLLS